MTSERPERGLRRHLAEMAQADISGVLEEARVGARARARKAIEDALVEELLAAGSAPQRATAPARPTQEEGELWWAYCILAAERVGGIAAGLSGVEPGSTVEAVVEGDLAALVSPVPLAEYGDERLREHLEDVTWLERTARGHEAVLDTALAQTTIIPLRLCTLYRARDGMRRVLRDHARPLMQSLAELDGTTEWGVKLFLAGPTTPREPAESTTAAESGKDYLAGLQQKRQQAQRADELCSVAGQAVHETVGAVAREERLNPVQRPEAHGRPWEMILNAAYLVERDREGDLRAAVAALQERWEPEGFAVELTGPWPPYNFAGAGSEMVP